MRAFECAKQGLDVWKNNPPEHAASLSAYWRALHLVLAASLYHNRQSAAALKTCEQVLDMDSQDLEALLLSAEIHFYTHTYQKSKEFYLRVKAQRGDELLASSGYAVESHWIRGRCVWLEALDLIHRLERGYVHLLREGVERLVILSDHHNRTSTEDAQRDELINRFGLALSKDELFFLDGLLQILEEVTVALEHNNNRPNLLTNGLENDDTRLLEVLVLRSRLLWILQRHASAKPLLMRAVQLGEHFQESLSPHLEEVLARAWCLLGQWYWYHGQEKAEHDWRTHAKKCWLKSLTLYPGSDAVADYDAGLLFVRCCLTEGTPSELQHVQSVLSELHDRRHVIWPLFPLALLHLKRGTRQDTVTAVSALQRYLRVHHSDLKAWLVLVEAYRRQGKYNAALRVAHHLNELNNNNNNNNKTSPLSYEVHYHIASINAKLGLLPDARVAFERCLQLLPPRPQHGEDPALSYRTLTLWGLSTVCLKLIQLAYRQGQMTRAWSLLVDTERLLSSHSISFSHVTFWKLFGDVCLHYFLFRVWFPTNMKNTDTTTTLRQMQLSHWQLILNKLSDGMKAYLRAIQYARDQPTLYYDVAVACVYIAQLLRQMEVMESDNVKRETAQQQRIKYLHEALSHVRDVLVLRPTSSLLRANAWNLKGFIHVLLNQFALAHHCFVVSYRVLPTRAASLRHIAAVLLHHNVPSDVTEQLLRKALSIEPTDACSWLALATTLETTPSNTSRSITSSTPFSLYSLYLSAYDLDNTLSEAVEGMARLTVVHYTSSKDNHNHSHLRSEHVTVGGESTLRIWDRRVLLGLIHLTQREPWRIESLHLLGLWYAREAQLQALQHTLRNPMTTDARIALLQLAIDTLQRAMNSLVEEEPELQSHYRTVLQMNLARVRTLLALSCGERSSIVEALHQWQMIRPVTSRHRLRTSLGLAATHFAARQFSEAATILRNLSLDTDINQLCNDLLVLCPLWLAKVSYFTSDSSFATLTTTLTHTYDSVLSLSLDAYLICSVLFLR
jgi:tetratricopeptide (TPR) repeat protein